MATASEAIKAIQALIDKHGDLPISLDDPDTGWQMPIGVIFDEEGLILITSAYTGEPNGCIGDYTHKAT